MSRSMLKPYEDVITKWDKAYGPKPTNKQLKEIQQAGLARTGSKTAYALAMLMREEGANQAQIKQALGSTYRNRANQLCVLGLARMKRQRVGGRTTYRLEVRQMNQLKQAVAEGDQHAAL